MYIILKNQSRCIFSNCDLTNKSFPIYIGEWYGGVFYNLVENYVNDVIWRILIMFVFSFN